MYYRKFVPIRAADLTNMLSVKDDVLLKLSKDYNMPGEKKESLSEVQSNIERIDRLLGTNTFQKRARS